MSASYNPGTGRLERIEYDRNQNGKTDAWMFMDGTRPVRAELDQDHDGVVDRWEYFASPAGTPGQSGAPTLERVELASGPGGVVTRREFYERGALVRVEEDTDGDGRADKWETWTAGVLAAVSLDTTGDGEPDRRIVYPADGSEPRFEATAP